MARSGMKPVYIGDVGQIVPRTPKMGIPKEVDISHLSFRDLCNLAVVCGFELRDIIGIKSCFEHQDKILLADRALPDGMNLFEHCVYCKNCFQFFRIKEIVNGGSSGDDA